MALQALQRLPASRSSHSLVQQVCRQLKCCSAPIANARCLLVSFRTWLRVEAGYVTLRRPIASMDGWMGLVVKGESQGRSDAAKHW